MGAPFSIYNTLSGKVEPFTEQEKGKVSLYVCGMTVYDHCHVGHARAMVVFDAFVRYLRFRGWDVLYVRNFTDVDDKIIARAKELKRPALELAQEYIEAFQRDVKALGLIQPSAEPRVTESITQIIALIAKLVETGHAYVAEGSVWFAVKTCTAYGKLSHRDVDQCRSADDVGGKRHPADFALWKAVKPDEPAWDSPWGSGRPGWHIECSAMSKACLGETVDIHGGGLDLVFPHHENEIAQSECGNGKPYARYWMHNGLLTMSSGQKMGKSLGNVINVCEALDSFPAEALRLYYLQNHYRSPLPWDEESLTTALGMLARLYEARETAEAMQGEEDPARVAKELGADAEAVFSLGQQFEERFLGALDHDFNTAQALGYLFEVARAVNRFASHKKARKRGAPVVAGSLAAFGSIAKALGLLAQPVDSFHEEVKCKRLAALGISVEEIESQLNERSAAREAKDWQRADGIRSALESRGIMVMDRPDRIDWRVRL